MNQTISLPRKQRELHNHHFDSTIWNDFQFRDDDIIIATYAKSGTTWMQQIVGQLLFNGNPDIGVAEMSPWLDLRIPPKEVKLPLVEAQTHRRFIKTHLPVDALVLSPKAKYIYIGRDGRDVIWSMYNHHANANQGWYDALNLTPGLVGPTIDRPLRISANTGLTGWRATAIRFGHSGKACAVGGKFATCPICTLYISPILNATCPARFDESANSWISPSTSRNGMRSANIAPSTG